MPVFLLSRSLLSAHLCVFNPLCNQKDKRHDSKVSDNLGSVTALREALERLPDGTEVVRMFAKLGLWTSELHRNSLERRALPSEFSKLSAQELSDLSSRVVSDAGRVLELVGLLTGLDAKLRIKIRAAKAAARSRSRRAWPEDAKAPTKTELDDLADEDTAVVTLEEQAGLLQVMLAQANAVREANQMYREAISREITYRSAQLQSRVY